MGKEYYRGKIRCHICGLLIPFEFIDHKHPLFGTIDHIVPRSAGGGNEASNRAPAHRVCNAIKGSKVLTAEVRRQCLLAAAKQIAAWGPPDTKRWKADRATIELVLNREKGLTMEQPNPTPTTETPTWELVIADMHRRNQDGISKYGTPLQPSNGRDSLQDAYEEALDLAVYLKNEIEKRKRGV